MDEFSCETHCAVMRSVFNLPPASEGVQRAFRDTDRPERRRRSGAEMSQSATFVEFLPRETLLDARGSKALEFALEEVYLSFEL